ncbi:MAG: hypothetical protein DLM59_07670 [Pseudonocardiales bacterium]|nr:MAG: hypothetical protein DLM59_07670 [Pseudonocardiales bacterium]
MKIPTRSLAVLLSAALSLVMLSTGAPASAAVTPPFDLLPAGPAPTTIPYAIGMKIFYGGRSYVVPALPQSSLVRVQPYHGNVLTSVFTIGVADFVGPAGMIGPTSAWHVFGGTDLPADATLAGQLLKAGQGEAQVVDTFTGRIVARHPIGGFGDVKAVGGEVLITVSNMADPRQHEIWDPATGATTVLGTADYTVAQRRSPGWLWRPLGGGCSALVTVSAPTATGTTVCHPESGPPLLSFDGTTAVAVRGGRLVALTVASGAVLSTGSMAAITGTNRAVQPVQWETSSAYIAVASWDGQTALVRCQVSSGACARVVRSSIRPGVRGIVAGW